MIARELAEQGRVGIFRRELFTEGLLHPFVATQVLAFAGQEAGERVFVVLVRVEAALPAQQPIRDHVLRELEHLAGVGNIAHAARAQGAHEAHEHPVEVVHRSAHSA